MVGYVGVLVLFLDVYCVLGAARTLGKETSGPTVDHVIFSIPPPKNKMQTVMTTTHHQCQARPFRKRPENGDIEKGHMMTMKKRLKTCQNFQAGGVGHTFPRPSPENYVPDHSSTSKESLGCYTSVMSSLGFQMWR